MPRRLELSEDAIHDVNAIRRWLTQPGAGPAALRRLKAVQSSIRGLQQHPCRYPIGDDPGVRELPCPHGYRALYEVHPDTSRNETAGDVTVLRVFGPGQDRSGINYFGSGRA